MKINIRVLSALICQRLDCSPYKADTWVQLPVGAIFYYQICQKLFIIYY